MMKLFHCTPVANEAAIDREGLRPTWWLKHTGEYVLEPVHVSEEYALADFICDLHGSDVIVYEVNYERLVLHPGHDGLGTFAINEPVPPSALTKLGLQKPDGVFVEAKTYRRLGGTPMGAAKLGR